MAYVFARDPVWSQTTCSGFRQQVFVMYHATRDVENVRNILSEGFKRSQSSHLLLGDGMYVSRDINKSLNYGEVCFKLLVYPGKTFRVDDSTPELERKNWQQEYSSAWLVPNSRVHPSGLEETCVKSSAQVRIVGIACGYEKLDFNTQASVKDCFGTGDNLDPDDNRLLDLMLEDLGIIYSTFVHTSSQLLLEAYGNGRVGLGEWNGYDNQLWSRTWDCCLENKATGEVLTLDDEDENEPIMRAVDQIGDKTQKWRLDGRNRFVQKQFNKYLSSDGRDGVVMKRYNHGGDRETWMFRCLNQTRTTDTFVKFTPWHDMTVWD